MKATARIPSPDAPLPYPEAPSSGDCPLVVFWTFHWMRDTAELEEFNAYRCTKTVRRQVDRSLQLWMALQHSQYALREIADKSLANLQKSGGLLFAWAGTSVVRNGEVPA